MRLRLNPLAQNGLSVVEPTIVNSTTSSSTTTGGTVPTSVDDLSPSQTGNAGKFLKTDGTNATWEAIPGGGDMLTTNNLSDLTDAATARTNLGVDAAGTDNSTNVTLAGTGTYISLTGQQITVDPITESDITDLNHAVDAVSNVATSTVLGRVTAGSGNSEELTAAQVRTLINVADGATANSSDATLLARANHTGTQSADTITDGTTNKAYTATEKTKLAGIAAGATANSSDATLLDTDNHTSGTTNKVYTATEQSKLAGIETGAEVNNISDVNATDLTDGGTTTLHSHTVTKSDVGLGNVDNTSDATKLAATLAAVYPVGSIYTSTVSTNPATLLGFGTWAAYGEGRVMVGKAASGTFATGGATGGAETHTLSEAEMPSHTHSVTDPGHAHGQKVTTNAGGTGVRADFDAFGSGYQEYAQGVNTYGSTTDISLGNTGSGSAHNNLQPYIVTYFWERVA